LRYHYSLDGEGLLVAEEVAELDAVELEGDVLGVGDLEEAGGGAKFSVVEGLVDVSGHEESFCFLGVVADEVGDDEEGEDGDDHDRVGSHGRPHLP
jgi:hypothetical protein